MRAIFYHALALVLFCATISQAAEPTLTLKQDDLWVMAGDSITAQRLHSNYIEAFFRARYPNLNLHFRNSGIGGNTTASVLARFDYDVAAWKPTIVSIELAMNDVGRGDDPAAYIKGMRDLIAKIRAIHAQPVLISSSPVDDGSVMDKWTSDRCRRIHPYTEALKKLAAEENLVVIDQYHPLLEIWGKNRAKQSPESAAADAAKNAPKPKGTPAPKPAPVKTPPAPEVVTPGGYVPIGGNPVHPGVVGQYMMAATILSGLKVDHEVSSATIKADGTVVDAKGCKITDAAAKDGKITFTRLDEAGTWPIDPAGRTALYLMPEMAELSRNILTVTGLPAGRYRISINDKPAAVVTEKELAAGWNMTTSFEGAVADRSTTIVKLIGTLQGNLNNDWRAASKAHDEAKLAAAQKAIEAQEALVRTACTPTAMKFEIQAEK